MKFYKAVVVEKTAVNFGQTVANTKSSNSFKGMGLQDFTEATKYISCFKIEIFEL